MPSSSPRPPSPRRDSIAACRWGSASAAASPAPTPPPRSRRRQGPSGCASCHHPPGYTPPAHDTAATANQHRYGHECSGTAITVSDTAGTLGGRLEAHHAEKGRSRDGSASHFRGHSRSEEHTSELQSLMRISNAVLCLKKKKK